MPLTTAQRLACPPWSPQEDRQLRQGVRELPGRTKGATYNRCRVIGISQTPHAKKGVWRRRWTVPELRRLIAGERCFEGRTPKAVEFIVTRLGIGRPQNYWTDEQVAQLRGGCRTFEGRTRKSVEVKCDKLGLPRNPSRPSPWWKPGELALLRSGEIPAGRTKVSCQVKARKLGFAFKVKTIAAVAPAAKGLSASVAYTAKPSTSGYNLLNEILKEVGHGLPQHLKDEIVAEAACLALGEGLSAKEAVKRARPAARRFEQNPKHKQLEDCFWL